MSTGTRYGFRFVIEGLPGAGKTSIAQHLTRELGIPLIPEWIVDEMTLRTMPFIRPFFVVNDLLKDSLAREMGTTIFDRHYFGALAFSHALTVVPHHAPGESASENEQYYQEALNCGALIPPRCVLVLDIPEDVSLRRQPRARHIESLFGDRVALQAMRTYYAELDGPFSVRYLDATRNFDAVAREAAEIVRSISAQPVEEVGRTT